MKRRMLRWERLPGVIASALVIELAGCSTGSTVPPTPTSVPESILSPSPSQSPTTKSSPATSAFPTPTTSPSAIPTATPSSIVIPSPSTTSKLAPTTPPSSAPSPYATIAGHFALTAQNMSFSPSVIMVTAGSNVTINFSNKDPGVLHAFAIYSDPNGTSAAIFRGNAVSGPGTVTYDFTAPSTPGTYFFRCTIHTSMRGLFVVMGAIPSS
jgi:plastocyanin